MPTITIPKGATLSGLAQQYKTTAGELLRLNPQIKDPNLIYAGASLNIPEKVITTPEGIQLTDIPGRVPGEYGVEITKPSPTPTPAPTTQITPTTGYVSVITDKGLPASFPAGQPLPPGYKLAPTAVVAPLVTPKPEPIIPVTEPTGVVSTEEQRQKEAAAKAEEERLRIEREQAQQREITSLANQKAIQDLQTALGITTGRPPVPTYASDFEALRSEQGIAAIETRINSINSQIADIEASLRAGLYTEEGKLRPMELIGTRQRELQRQTQEILDTLNRSKQVLVDEYNTKANLINSTMKFKEMDYAAATNAYNTQFTQAIQLQTLLMTAEERALAEENRLRDDSRANLTILQNLVTDSGQTWDQVSPAIQSQIQTLELKAGLPTGVMQTFLTTKPGMKIDHVTSAYDAQGRQIVSFFSYNNGDPQLMKSIYTGGVQQLTITEQREAILTEAKNAMDAKLKSLAGTSGFVSSTNYKTQKEIWMRAGYDAKDFDIAFRRYTDPTQLWSYGLEPL